MLVIEKNSVYEIDEDCLKRKRVPEECEVYKKFANRQKGNREKESCCRKNTVRTFY